MQSEMLEKLRYPIGIFQKPVTISNSQLEEWIADIAAHPRIVKVAIGGLSEEQLNEPYREGGWTVRQTVHHLADSHLNAYTRFKLALTEDTPIIKPYEEQLWAELADGKEAPLEWSLLLLEALHLRWTMLLKSLQSAQFARTFVHPASGEVLSLAVVMGMYSWHCRHHVAHITTLRERMGW